MRLIDADAIKIPSTHVDMFENCRNCELLDEEQVREIIDSAPTIEVPKWIPCSERLPKRQGYYICTCKDGSKYKRTTTVKWSNGWQLAGARSYWIVLAWMPLPKPYEEKEHE